MVRRREGAVVVLSLGEVNTVRDPIREEPTFETPGNGRWGFKRESLPQTSNLFDDFAINLAVGCISMQVRTMV